MANSRLCSIENCSKPVKGRSMCSAHYVRFMKYGDPLAGKAFVGEKLLFLNNAARSHVGNECLFFPFGTSSNGYALVRVKGTQLPAHRYVCELVNGKPKHKKLEAAHSCGKGHLGCVNPQHLSWKTRTENQADRLVHGTAKLGSKSHFSKLNETQVKAIRAMSETHTRMQIAAAFGISRDYVGEIIRRATWAWLP